MGKYEKYWCYEPGLIIILLDQSTTMLQPYNDKSSRLEVSINMVNRSIDYFIQGFWDGEAPKNRCFIYVIGYNNIVKELCSGWIRDLDSNPFRYETIIKKMPDGAGGIVEVEVRQPVWVDLVDVGGDANMYGAFSYAKELVQKWISDNPQYPAPVIINISDGVPYYDGKDSLECMKETTDLAKEIMSLSNDDGNVLIYNVHVGGILKNTELFSNDRDKLKQEESKFLFDISSEVPEPHLGYCYKYYDAEIWQQLLWQGSRGLTSTIGDVIHTLPSVFGSEPAKYVIIKIPEPTNDNMAESIKVKWRKGNGYKMSTTKETADKIKAQWKK